MCFFCGCGDPFYKSTQVILPSALKENPKGKKEESRPQPAQK